MLLKRSLISTFVVCLILMSLGVPVSAAGLSIPVEAESSQVTISPMMLYLDYTSTQLSISSSGVATAVGNITGFQGITDEVYIFLYLEKYTNGSWTTVNSWMQSFASYRGTLTGTYSVSSGYSYRVKGSYYAYSGENYEHTIQYSNSIYY